MLAAYLIGITGLVLTGIEVVTTYYKGVHPTAILPGVFGMFYICVAPLLPV